MKATQDQLNELHGVVARVLTDQLLYTEDETTFNEDGEIVPTGNKRFIASPSTVAAAIKLLKDNHTTADIANDENLTGLRDALAKKQRHSRLSGADAANVVALHEE